MFILHSQLSCVNATSFSKSFREWKCAQDQQALLRGEERFTCPVCVKTCHSIHIDGHRKTYRFKKVPRYVMNSEFLVNDYLYLYHGF